MRLVKYHDVAVKVTNSAFYLNHVTCGGPKATYLIYKLYFI